MRLRSLFVLLALVAAVIMLIGATPAAAVPPVGPQTILDETFEADSSAYSVIPYVDGVYYTGTGHWARVVQRRHGGAWGLWCAGSKLTTTSALSAYPKASAGRAIFPLAQLADYYSSEVSFYYTMPSRGLKDETGFVVMWNSINDSTRSNRYTSYPLTEKYSWAKRTYDMSEGSAGLAREPVDLVFAWYDRPEGALFPQLGEGPTVDDVKVVGWKYGPARSLTATVSGPYAALSWFRPARSAADSQPEEREIGYRVFSAPAGSSNWKELTASSRLGDSALEFKERLTNEGIQTRYALQPSDIGLGDGAGAASEVTLTVPARAPQANIVAPLENFSLADGAVKVAGTASDVGTGVNEVEVRVRRSDGMYWSGSQWLLSEQWVSANTAASWATWDYDFVPDVETVASGKTVDITARATDLVGLMGLSPAIISAGTPLNDTTAPTVTLSAPGTGFLLGPTAVTINGTASDSGSGLASVVLRIERQGQYWNGIGWQPEVVHVPAAGLSIWSAIWIPDLLSVKGYEPVTISAVAQDFAGNTAVSSVVSVDPKEPVTLSTKTSAATISYGDSASITGTLTSMAGTALADKRVILQYYSSGWKSSALQTQTTAAGTASFQVRPVSRTTYRLLFAGDQQYLAGSPASGATVLPKVSLSIPSAPVSAVKGRAFTSSGVLRPRHASGSYPVRTYKERYVGGGVWKSYGYVKARAYNDSGSTYSRFKGAVSFPSAGTWRLRAYAPADSAHAATYSVYSRSVKVR